MEDLYEELVRTAPPPNPAVLFDTATVLGGSVAGLMAARVLSDYARRVVVVDPGAAVPQAQQVHTLLPAGREWLDRWLPGFTEQARQRGASLVSDAGTTLIDGVPQVPDGAGHRLLAMSRHLLETLIRDRVTALPNVSELRERATAVPASDFVVDAMGRSSRLSHWLADDGYDQPRLERLEVPVNYATARFDRTGDLADLEKPGALALFTAGPVSVAAAQPIEDGQWIVMLMGYGDHKPGRSLDEFRTVCAGLPSIFATATAGRARGDVVTYHQAESRRRDYTAVRHFPARLVSVGDAVASFNPIYGQGMSSAALHASCLAAYLAGGPDLDSPAHDFFRRQQLVVDAAWSVSAGGDAARLDALSGAEVPEEVRRQREAINRITAATLVDGTVTSAFNNVSYMLRHPGTLADPDLLARAAAAL
jgi:2-polyprenyl-6-methoxyphenol hydroxylase-like FAD-dependent oxidoreductase